uniref:CCHC-type domain-containing protein n=1 Tax=Cajanus cajan TaxID=3821 RepID=A0A151QW68_CAJCA|nr:hypothetical protein KK1_044556 [Cajanus cajan]
MPTSIHEEEGHHTQPPSESFYSSHHNDDYYQRPPRQHRHRESSNKEPNITLPSFHGKDNVETYLDWEMKVEQLFSFHGISEERKVSLATLSFQGHAMYWWTSLEKERRKNYMPPNQYWNELCSALKRRNIPPYYDCELMDKIHRLKQGSSSVEEYSQSIELLMMRVGIREEERTTISRFQSGLNLEIRDKVELLPYRYLNELVQLCSRLEHQLKRKYFRKDSTLFYSKSFKKEGHSSQRYPEKEKEKEKEKSSFKAPSKESKSSEIKCFKCLGRGHIASQCPTKKTMVLKAQDHYSSLDEAISSSSTSEDEAIHFEE